MFAGSNKTLKNFAPHASKTAVQCQNDPGSQAMSKRRRRNWKDHFLHQMKCCLGSLALVEKHSIECQDIVIQESDLNWTNDKEGQEQDLPPCDIELDAENTDVQPSVQDRGTAVSQAADWDQSQLSPMLQSNSSLSV
jgi:hypothetical protein